MSPRASKEPAALPRVRRAKGVVAVRKQAVKILQQQLDSMADRVLSRDEREFVLEAVKALTAVTKARATPINAGMPPASKTDPAATLGD